MRSSVALQIGQVLTLDLTLNVGAKNDILMVTEAAPMTDTQSSNVAQVVTQDMLADLPLPNRAPHH